MSVRVSRQGVMAEQGLLAIQFYYEIDSVEKNPEATRAALCFLLDESIPKKN
jgi:hypothetical protein